MIPLLVFLVLLTNKLDESIRISYFSASTPLFLTFVTLIMASFGARGGKSFSSIQSRRTVSDNLFFAFLQHLLILVRNELTFLIGWGHLSTNTKMCVRCSLTHVDNPFCAFLQHMLKMPFLFSPLSLEVSTLLFCLFQAINTGSALENRLVNSCSGFAHAFSSSETFRTAFTRTDSRRDQRRRCRSRRRRPRRTFRSSSTTTERRSLRRRTRCWWCRLWPLKCQISLDFRELC